MAVSKVILNGTTLMDVTQDTVVADKLLQTYTATKNDGTKVTGTLIPSVAPTLQSKTVSPSTSQQTVSPDSGYDGLSSVTVNAMPSGSATTPATTITASPTISVSSSGLITASVSNTQGVTPSVTAGYVASGTSGTITVNGSNTNQLTVYNGAHHAVSSGYTVTVSLTNPRNASYFSGCVIKSCSYEYDVDGAEIGTITSATGSTEVTVTTEHIYVEIKGSNTAGANITITGNIEEYGYGEYPIMVWYVISGNGTITFDNVNYDD